MNKKTLFDKIWDSHVIKKVDNGPDILFIDRHLIHEVTSPVAFLGLKNRNLNVMYPNLTFATADHNTPTINQHLPIRDPLSAKQLQTLKDNTKTLQVGDTLTGASSTTARTIASIVDVMTFANLSSAQNKEFEDKDSSYLDFSEVNPFGEP